MRSLVGSGGETHFTDVISALASCSFMNALKAFWLATELGRSVPPFHRSKQSKDLEAPVKSNDEVSDQSLPQTPY